MTWSSGSSSVWTASAGRRQLTSTTSSCATTRRTRRSARAVSACAWTTYAYQRHIYDKTRPENLAFLRRLRALLQRYPGASSVAEIGCDESLRTMAAYTSGGDTLHMAYSFDLLTEQCSPAYIRRTVEGIERELADGWSCWSMGNHDVVR